MHEFCTARDQFGIIYHVVFRVCICILEGSYSVLFTLRHSLYVSYSSRSFHSKEITGRGDKERHTHVVGKEKRCDSTFAYQQLMYDMSREIVHYTSRYVALAWVHINLDGRLLEHSVFVN